MPKLQEWDITVDGQQYHVAFEQNRWSDKYWIEVNGYSSEYKPKAFEVFKGVDIPLMLGKKEVRLVLKGNKADIAVDGVFVDSKKPYIPSKNMPWWTWIFIAACVVFPIVTIGGAIAIALAFIGVAYCIRVSVSPYMKTSLKLLTCLGISVSAWVLFILIDHILSLL
jgi:hypothetical protein